MSMSLGEYIYTVGLDSKAFTTGLKKTSAQLKDFGTNAKKVGGSLTKNLTLPIALAGAASLKLAADFEVSGRKFAAAFKGAEEAANSSVENLNENFGLASSQATRLLANTGDLLKGFGASSTAALELSNSTQELAASLAAYNGVPVVQASEAITKALLGETEGLKQLGVVVKQSDVQRQLEIDGTSELTGEKLLLAKAQATLTLAYGQSTDAIGSFVENQDTLAFQTNALVGDLKDLGVEIGTILLPVVKDIVDEVRGAVDWFRDLDESQKANLVTIAAFVAAAGPLIAAIGGIATALAFLAANPIILAVAGVVALTAAVVALGAKRKRENIEALTEEFDELAIATGVAEEEMELFVQSMDAAQDALERADFGATFEGVSYQVDQLSTNLGQTKEAIILAGLESENLSDNMRDILENLLEQVEVEDLLAQVIKDQKDDINQIRGLKAESLDQSEDTAKAEAEITAELERQKQLRQDIEDTYQAAWEDYKQLIQGSKTELELLDEQIASYERLDNASTQYNQDRATALQVLQDKRKELQDEEYENLVEAQEAIDEVRDLELETQKQRLEDYRMAHQAAEDAKNAAEEKSQREREARIQQTLEMYSTFAGNAANIFNNLIQLQMEGDEEKTEQEKKNILILFGFQKAASIAQIAMDSAVAIFRQYKDLPIWLAIPASIITAALAVTQIALVASQQPPALAEGGVLTATPGGRLVQVAEDGDDEAVIPLNDSFFEKFRDRVIGSSLGSVNSGAGNDGSPVVIKNVLDGKIISQTVVGYINNRTSGTQIKNTSLVSA